MKIQYVVTTKIDRLPQSTPIIMVDGTVPGWVKGYYDLHFDHHKPDGGLVQVDEMPALSECSLLTYEYNSNCNDANFQAYVGYVYDPVIVTTQVDADACVAAAWLQLTNEVSEESQRKLRSIAYDCDHLGLPIDAEWNDLREFARNAVAAMKLDGDRIAAELGLPKNRKEWDEEIKEKYASECFKQGTEWLISAAKGDRAWPGENGEATAYWSRVEPQRSMVEKRCRLIDGVAVLDMRGINEYIDPRLLVEWTRKQEGHSNVTLTVRDRVLELFQVPGKGLILPSQYKELVDYEMTEFGCVGTNDTLIKLPAYAYTLGSIPLHADGSPKFSDRSVWQKLADAERVKRSAIKFPAPSSDWGGRNEVGGSSWNDAVIMLPEEVIRVVLSAEN